MQYLYRSFWIQGIPVESGVDKSFFRHVNLIQGFCIAKLYYISHVMRKPDFCLCENRAADQLRSNCEADQRLCFRYSDSTISLLPKSGISSFWPSSVLVQLGLCQTWSETPKTGFLASRLI